LTNLARIDVAALAKVALQEFSTARYSQAIALRFRDWWSLLELRRDILDCLSQGLWLSPVECASIVRRISEGPLVTMGEGIRPGPPSVSGATFGELRKSAVLAEAYLNEQTLALASARELYARKSDLELRFGDAGALSDADEEEYFTICSDVRRLEDLSERPFSAALADAVAGNGDEDVLSSRWILSVDTSAPDEVLVIDFRAWLKTHRQAAGRREGLSEADLRRWAQHRVLPYIDLRPWSSLQANRTSLLMHGWATVSFLT
jgi:hypothetical protein